MALYHGKGGMATWDTTDLLHIVSFTLNTSVSMGDTSEMGDAWRDNIYGLKDFSITINLLNSDAFDFPAYLGADKDLGIELADSAGTITGHAICTGVTENQPVDDVGTVTLTYVGDDTTGLAYTGGLS